MRRVLVVDDEEDVRRVLRTLLEERGYEVEVAASAEEALGRLDAFDPDFVLADVRVPGTSDRALCREVLRALRNAEERGSHRGERARAGMLGESEAIRRVFRTIDKVAAHKTTVLVQGESGTGKELVARALHDGSPRADAPFVAVNCGAIPEALLESELFGHKKGAFTDAHADKRGLFDEADGGTLFLDEIGELPQALQVKLLRVLEESVVRPVGAVKAHPVDVRVVAATVRDLRREVEEGRFREDLYYRLNVLQLDVPPLRDRREDIALLAERFIERHSGRLGRRVRGMDAEARALLLEYHWPGNVRELENVIERAVVLSDCDRLRASDLPDRVREPGDPVATTLATGELSIKKTTRAIEETLIRRALERTKGNRTAASKLLEISHRALLYKLKDYGIA